VTSGRTRGRRVRGRVVVMRGAEVWVALDSASEDGSGGGGGGGCSAEALCAHYSTEGYGCMNDDVVRNGVYRAAIEAQVAAGARAFVELGPGANAMLTRLVLDAPCCPAPPGAGGGSSSSSPSTTTVLALEANAQSAAAAAAVLRARPEYRGRWAVLHAFVGGAGGCPAALHGGQLAGVGALVHEVLGFLAGCEGVARAVLQLQSLLPRRGQGLVCVPAAAGTFFVPSFVRPSSLRARGGSGALYAAPAFLLAARLPFSEVALVAPRAAAAAGGGAAAAGGEPPPLVHAGGSAVGCLEFFRFGSPMEAQLVQARSTTFVCGARCVINSVACFVWAGFAAGAPAAGERADGRARRGRRPTGFPYGVAGLLGGAAGAAQAEADAEDELGAASFSSCDWDADAGACASAWRNLVVRLGAPLHLAPGDALRLAWHVSHAGPASAYALTASVERAGGGPGGVPPFRVELGELYPTFRPAAPGEAGAALDAAWGAA